MILAVVGLTINGSDLGHGKVDRELKIFLQGCWWLELNRDGSRTDCRGTFSTYGTKMTMAEALTADAAPTMTSSTSEQQQQGTRPAEGRELS